MTGFWNLQQASNNRAEIPDHEFSYDHQSTVHMKKPSVFLTC